MNTKNFYQHLNRSIPVIQSFAIKLTKDFDTARFLYQETAHRAIKNKNHLQEDTLEDWLINTMKKIYSKLIRGDMNKKLAYEKLIRVGT